MGGYSQRRRFNNEFDVFGAYHELDFNLNDYVCSQGSRLQNFLCLLKPSLPIKFFNFAFRSRVSGMTFRKTTYRLTYMFNHVWWTLLP